MPDLSRRHLLPATLAASLVGAAAAEAKQGSGDPPGDLRADLQKLLDREAIRELPIAYCHFIWKRNVDDLVALFATNARIKVPTNISGPEALRSFYQRGLDGTVAEVEPRPFIHNHHLNSMTDEQATGSAYAEIRNRKLGWRVTQIAVYDDIYVKEDGVWKFQERDLTIYPVAS